MIEFDPDQSINTEILSAWETLVYFLVCKSLRDAQKRTRLPKLYCTNCPAYLCRSFHLEMGGSQYRIKVGNFVDALTKPVGANFIKAANALADAYETPDLYKLLAFLQDMRQQKDASMYISDVLVNHWNWMSGIPLERYRIWCYNPVMNTQDRFARQDVEYLQYAVTVKASDVFVSYGDLFEPQATSAILHNRNLGQNGLGNRDTWTLLPLLDNLPLRNQRTCSSMHSSNRRLRPTGTFSSSEAIDVLALNNDAFGRPDKTSTTLLAPNHGSTFPALSFDCLGMDNRLSEDGPLYLVASDIVFRDMAPIRTKVAERLSNLDLFLGGLPTGALVFPTDPFSTLQSTQTDASDELSQWFILILGAKTASDFTLEAKCTRDTLAELQLKTQASTILNGSSGNTAIIFSSANNKHAFNIDTPLSWPAVDSAHPDIPGKPQIICLSLGDKDEIYSKEISGSQILRLCNIQSSRLDQLLSNLVGFSLDKSTGARNAFWFSPDCNFTTMLRVCFVPSQKTGEALEKLADSVNLLIAEWTSHVVIKHEKLQVIVKKTWLKKDRPYTVLNDLIICSKMTLTAGKIPLTFQMGISFGPKSTSWTLNFEQSNSVPGFASLLDWLKVLFSLQDAIPDISDTLPQLNAILPRRIKYTSFNNKTWLLTIEVQVVAASMAFFCSTVIRNVEPKFSFYGGLFAENRPGKEGVGEVFTFSQYLPDSEPWETTFFWPTPEASKGSNVGNLANFFKASSGEAVNRIANDEMLKAPFDLRLIEMNIAYTDLGFLFGATVMSPRPDPNDSRHKVPTIRFNAARLKLLFATKKAVLQELSLATRVELSSPRTEEVAYITGSISYGPANSSLTHLTDTENIESCDGFNYVSVSKTRDMIRPQASQGSWVFAGSVTGLSGGLVYSLCDSDCNEEMVRLLDHVSLDLGIKYIYQSGYGNQFTIDGILYLGDLQLHCNYQHNGRTGLEETPGWKFSADLKIANQKSSLLLVIESICGTDLSSYLPDCVKKIEVAPSQDTSLTSLLIVSNKDWMAFYARVQLTDNSSILLYQIQRKRKVKGAAKEQRPVKRIMSFQLAKLPSVKDIPIVGDFQLPFTSLHFCFVSSGEGSEEGLLEEEVIALNKYKPEQFAPITYKEKEKKASEKQVTHTKDETQASSSLIPNGFHFMVVNDTKVLLDYLFGRPKPSKGKVIPLDENVSTPSAGLTPFNKKVGPVTITSFGLKFNLKTQKLSFLINGTVAVGPLELSLQGLGISFMFNGTSTLRDLTNISMDFSLNGLGLSFQKSPVILAGYLEHTKTPSLDKFQGGATIGFKPWMFQAAGYYAVQSKLPPPSLSVADNEVYKCFVAFARLTGPIATIGYAEIREVVAGLGYNTSLTFPTMANITSFPFIAEPPSSPLEALQNLFATQWIMNKEESMWIAAGMTVLAFQILTIRAVVVVEWGFGIKLGIFGLATAEVPLQLDRKFAVVQLGLAATVDFDAGIMKIDGQLTPASYIIDPSCHLTGGFALYSWFGAANNQDQGDWVFSVGGYHSAYQSPKYYPKPPRLGISWSYDNNINILGEAYFAITPKVCMGGGHLRVTLSLGTLFAYFDAYADFLMNFQPFHYKAQGGLSVGVKFILDLWIVSIPINIEIGAEIFIEGNPMSGRVHVNFWVFGFDVNFGQADPPPRSLDNDSFWELILGNSSQKSNDVLLPLIESPSEDLPREDNAMDTEEPCHVFNCTSGLVSKSEGASQPSGKRWTVRGAVFAFTVTCKFPMLKATVITDTPDHDNPLPKDVPIDDDNVKKTNIYAKPMQFTNPLDQSEVSITIAPDLSKPFAHILAKDEPAWVEVQAIYSQLSTAIWGQYNSALDPNSGNNNKNDDLLDGTISGTVRLMIGVSLISPKAERSKDLLPAFNVEEAMKQIVGIGHFPKPDIAAAAFNPSSGVQYKAVKKAWHEKKDAAKIVTELWESLDCFEWSPRTQVGSPPQAPPPVVKKLVPSPPRRLVADLEEYLVESPVLCQG